MGEQVRLDSFQFNAVSVLLCDLPCWITYSSRAGDATFTYGFLVFSEELDSQLVLCS